MEKFNDRMREAHIHYAHENWKSFKQVFDENPKDVVEDFDLYGNTPIQIATYSNNPILLRDLLEMLQKRDDDNLSLLRKALTTSNRQNDTLLHEIALRDEVRMVDVVMEFETKVSFPSTSLRLVEMKNEQGETALFRAAKMGKLNMVKQIAKYVRQNDMENHLMSKPNLNILHACVYGQRFDVALWIMNKVDCSKYTQQPNRNGLTSLQLLSRMPRVFRSGHNGRFRNFLYHLLPDDEDEVYESQDSSYLCPQKTDIEGAQQHKAKPCTSGLSRINYCFWRWGAEAFEWIDDLLKENKKHTLACRLAKKLVEYDYSWVTSKSEANSKTTLTLPSVLFNVPQRKKTLETEKKLREEKELEIKLKEEKELYDGNTENNNNKTTTINSSTRTTEEGKYFSYTPLLIAASHGIKEIIEILLKRHPQAINHVSDDGQNVLHIAVKHRHLNIFKLLKRKPEFPALVSQISEDKGRSILHQVAIVDFYRGADKAGAAFQLQSELKWYNRVESDLTAIAPQYIMHCDNEHLTAGDLLDISHDDMLRDAQLWIKETCQSCSVLAVLLATVVFTAAYTLPGGTTSETGTPVLLRSPVFLFFTAMDIVALALSLASVVMYLSVLTSPFELWDFYWSLPFRLNIAFGFLFCGLTTTMLAFIATILLTLQKKEKEWTSTFVYAAALFPVTVLAFVQFPYYMRLPSLIGTLLKALSAPIRKLIRRRFGNKSKYP